jgi:branched-chain amino acid transport system ATP-binding protein
MTVIHSLAHEQGIGILLIEHTINLVMAVSDVIVVLNSGEKIAEGTPDEIRKNRSVLEAYLGF